MGMTRLSGHIECRDDDSGTHYMVAGFEVIGVGDKQIYFFERLRKNVNHWAEVLCHGHTFRQEYPRTDVMCIMYHINTLAIEDEVK
jgi:hypothetical protein